MRVPKKVYQHNFVDFSDIIYHPYSSIPLGVSLDPDYPKELFFNEGDGFAKFFSGLKQAFDGYHVAFTSFTRNGAKGILRVSGDRLPGDYFMVDLNNKKVDFLLSSADWLDPETLNPMQAKFFTSSHGLNIGTYLTFPANKNKQLPMIVMPHGGPHSRDFWGYDRDAQILSQAGYLALQVNFRGSIGYGGDFYSAGKKQWGSNIQRDIAEAVQWAIAEGYADPKRICIYGASFGGYSAMLNPIRYPKLYQCPAGFAGVYDLELLYKEGNIQRRDRGIAYLKKAVGINKQVMRDNSPLYLTSQLNLPVFIAHGTEDKRAPIDHAQALVKKLQTEDKDVHSLFFKNGGHGLYSEESNKKLYTQLLTFFDKHIGIGAAEKKN